MPNPTPTERGQEFLRGLAAKVTDPDARARVEALASAPEAVLQEIGTGVLRHDEFSREMDRLRDENTVLTKWREDLTTWHTTERGKLEADRAALEADPARRGNPPPAPAPGADVKLVEDKLNNLATVAPLVMAEMTELQMEHFQRFGERLDVTALVQHPDAAKTGLRGAYQTVFKDRLAANAKAAADAQEAELRKKIRAEVTEELRNTNQQLPYPVGGGDDIRSPLDALEQKPADGQPGSVVDRAVNSFYQHRAAGVGA